MKIRLSKILTIAAFIISASLYFPLNGHSDPTDQSASQPVPQQKPYKKKDIVNARFGASDKQAALKKAYQLKNDITSQVVGQDRVGQAMQDRLVQYLENLGTRTKDPIALHMIGLPGIGKSATLDVLDKTGIQVIRVDAQQFAGYGSDRAMQQLGSQLYQASEAQKSTGKPLILLFDEIDKVPEITKNEGKAEEKSNPLIGFINQILTDGKAPYPGNPAFKIDLSNSLVVTAMNFSPEEIESSFTTFSFEYR